MHWEEDKLFYGKVDTTIRLVKDRTYDFMYWLEWDFSTPQTSNNFYNISNAKDNARVLYLRYRNNAAEKACQEARGCV